MEQHELEDLEQYFISIVEFKLRESTNQDALQERERTELLRDEFIKRWIKK